MGGTNPLCVYTTIIDGKITNVDIADLTPVSDNTSTGTVATGNSLLTYTLENVLCDSVISIIDRALNYCVNPSVSDNIEIIYNYDSGIICKLNIGQGKTGTIFFG